MKTCETCGKEFSKPPRRDFAQHAKARFCSRTCADAMRLGKAYRPADERFWEKVDRDGPIPACRPDLGPCWIWTAAVEGQGYGNFYARGKLGLAHRWAYEGEIGVIPDGLELDHLCQVRRCVRPTHLEPVSHRENTLRGAAPSAVIARSPMCGHGHSEADGVMYSRGNRRICRLCTLRWNLAYRERQRLIKASGGPSENTCHE